MQVALKAQSRGFPVQSHCVSPSLINTKESQKKRQLYALSSYHKSSRLSIISLPQLIFAVRTDRCRTFWLCSFQDKIVSVKDKHPAFISIPSQILLTRMAYCKILLCLYYSGFVTQTEIISKVETRLICSEI